MEDTTQKYNTVIINAYINELLSQIEVIQYFKNEKDFPIELEMVIPQLSDINITRFEMIKKGQKIISKLLEKEKAKEKYNDTIATGNSSLVSYHDNNETKICLGNISTGEEIELKTYYFGHIVCKDLSYQAKFPVKFPQFLLENIKTGENLDNYKYNKKEVRGTIKINTNSNITRLVIKGSNNFSKIEKKYSDDKKSVEISIFKDNFSETDIPGIILFRTEKLYDEKLYYQYDPKKIKSYYILQKALYIPELKKEFKNEIDENENINYISLIKSNEEDMPEICYIFLLDQSGSMSGERMKLCSKALLLFLQSLNEKCYFQLVGFGSNYEYFSKIPLAYNKENIQNLMKTIKTLDANKGGTELYNPLNDIYNNEIYKEYHMKKSIILLTDGELFDKEKVINLIGSKSDEFIFNSLGICECDKDLIERTALLGHGYSYYINDLKDLNSVVISLLDKAKEYINFEVEINQKPVIEEKNNKSIEKYDFFTYGFILDEKDIKNIEFKIKIKEKKEIKFSFDKDKIIKLPDGDKLGKLIVDNFLKSENKKDIKTIIQLSKEYNILTNETAFYAKIANDIPITEKMVKITNKDKQAENNIEKNNYRIDDDKYLGYDDFVYYNEDIEVFKSQNTEEPKKGLFKGFFSKLFSKEEDNIIKKKQYKLKEIKEKKSITSGLIHFLTKNSKKNITERAEADFRSCHPDETDSYEDVGCYDSYDICQDYCIKDSYYIRNDYDDDYNYNSKKNDNYEIKEEKNKNKEVKEENKNIIGKNFDFDELILGQDIIEGNWMNDSQVKMLINEENDMFEKIKKLSENKGIKEENGIITLFILYYIYKKRSEKLGELKFVIIKANKYLKKIFNAEYEDIIKEI